MNSSERERNGRPDFLLITVCLANRQIQIQDGIGKMRADAAYSGTSERCAGGKNRQAELENVRLRKAQRRVKLAGPFQSAPRRSTGREFYHGKQ